MDRDEFRSLPFAEARAKLLEEMGLMMHENPITDHDIRTAIYLATDPPFRPPLRFGREA